MRSHDAGRSGSHRGGEPAPTFLHTRLAAAAIFALGAGMTDLARAAEWTIGGRVTQSLEADTNRDLDPDSGGPVYGETTSLNLAIGGQTKATEWTLNLGGRASFFFGPGEDDADLDGLRPRVSGSVVHERKQFFSRTGFYYDRSPTSFVRIDELGLPIDGPIDEPTDEPVDEPGFDPDDAVFSDVDAFQTTLNANQAFSFMLDPRNTIGLSARATIRRFSEETDELTPTTTYGGGLSWTHQVSPRTGLGFAVDLRRFEADNPENREALTLDLLATADRQVNERLSLGFSAGPSITWSEETVANAAGANRVEETDIGFTGGIEALLRRKTSRLSFSATQSVVPSSFGELANRTGVGLRYTYDINSVSSFSLATRYALRNSLDGSGGARHFAALSPSYTYRLTPKWQASVRYAFELVDDDDGFAQSNSVMLSLSRDFSILP